MSLSVGDDIKEMTLKSMQEVLITNFPAFDISITGCRKVLLAAVNGYAVGLLFVVAYFSTLYDKVFLFLVQSIST